MTEVQFAKQFLTTFDSRPTKYQPDHIFDPKTFQTRIPYTLPKLSHPPHPLPPQQATTAPPPPPGSTPLTSTSNQSAALPSDAQPEPTLNLTIKSLRNPAFTLNLPSLPYTTPISTLKTHIQSILCGNATTTTSLPAERIKILYNKKPIPASKTTVGDVLPTPPPQAPSQLLKEKLPYVSIVEEEFGVMIMGGFPDPTPTEQTIHTSSSSSEMEIVNEKHPNLFATSSPSSSVPATAPPPPPYSSLTTGTTTTESGESKTRGTNTERASEPVQPGEMSGEAVLQTVKFWDDLQGFLETRLRSTEVAGELRKKWEGGEGGGDVRR